MYSWWQTILDVMYPPKCPACKAPVGEQGAWCLRCLEKIVRVRPITIREHKLTALNSCWTVCEYTGSLKRIIHDMKFRRQERYGACLTWLVKNYAKLTRFGVLDVVIPVPLHAQRLQERGYNQTDAIFKAWFQDEKLRWMPELLQRTRPTIPQWELKSAQRQKNIAGAFLVPDPAKVKQKNILLVDDIFTTGITLEECATVLKQAGAHQVHALVVASGAH